MSRFCSIFSQLLQLFPRPEFQSAVTATKAERHARGFTCWDQFVAMLFAQLGRAHSLREICGGLASCEGKLAYPGAAAVDATVIDLCAEMFPWAVFRCTKGAVKLHFHARSRWRPPDLPGDHRRQAPRGAAALELGPRTDVMLTPGGR